MRENSWNIEEIIFGVEQLLTRQDMAVFLARAVGVAEEKGGMEHFLDSGDITPYARSSVGVLNDMGCISGFPDGTFRPMEYATRAEAAKILFMLMQHNTEENKAEEELKA